MNKKKKSGWITKRYNKRVSVTFYAKKEKEVKKK